MKTKQLEEAIAEDLLSDKPKRHGPDYEHCHSCGTGFNRNNRDCRSVRFDGFVTWYCSDRCKDWFQEGNPSYQEQKKFASKSNPHWYRAIRVNPWS